MSTRRIFTACRSIVFGADRTFLNHQDWLASVHPNFPRLAVSPHAIIDDLSQREDALKYEFRIVGEVDEGLTASEISAGGTDAIARVFELRSGWYVGIDRLERLREADMIDVLLRARDELLHYVNRKGGDAPEGAGRGAYSLWLMQRDDGKGFSSL